MSNYQSGHDAEKVVAEYLQKHGYKIIELNWKTRYCEIDIVASKANVVHFVEVKYRLNEAQGSGFDYITTSKIKQMEFAARMWITEKDWKDDYCLSAAEVTGTSYVVNYIEQL